MRCSYDVISDWPSFYLQSSTFSSIPPSDYPEGWKANQDHTDFIDKEFAELYKLPQPLTPLLYSRELEEVLLECGDGTYYIYNEPAQDVWRIVEPTNIRDILFWVNDNGINSKMKYELKNCNSDDEEKVAMDSAPDGTDDGMVTKFEKIEWGSREE